jgi:hypothetical protein
MDYKYLIYKQNYNILKKKLLNSNIFYLILFILFILILILMDYKYKYLKYKQKYNILKKNLTGSNIFYLELLYLDNIRDHIRGLILNENFNIDYCINSSQNLNISKDICKELLQEIISNYSKNLINNTNIKIKEQKIIKDNNIYLIVNIKKEYKDTYDIIINILNSCLINYYPTYIVNPIYYPTDIKYIIPIYYDK